MWDAKITLSKGSTCNIALGSIKFLGHLLGESLQASCQAASERKNKRVSEALKQVNQRPVRGEYKVWNVSLILLAVDAIPDPTIRSLQSSTTRYIKKWLNLPRCATPAAIFHPEVLNLPVLPHLREREREREHICVPN